jgi:hypothetical protein
MVAVGITASRITHPPGTGARVHRAAAMCGENSARSGAQQCVWWCRLRCDHGSSVPPRSVNTVGASDALPVSRSGERCIRNPRPSRFHNPWLTISLGWPPNAFLSSALPVHGVAVS